MLLQLLKILPTSQGCKKNKEEAFLVQNAPELLEAECSPEAIMCYELKLLSFAFSPFGITFRHPFSGLKGVCLNHIPVN